MMQWCFKYALAVGLASAQCVALALEFAAAKPVWPEGREKEWNCQVGFTAEFVGAAAKGAVLRFTGATMCRVFLNGEFLGYGPARAAHGFARVEELPLGGRAKEGLNVLAVEVAGYNCDSFYTVRQPSFLQAEIVAGDGRVIAATGVNGGFSARIVKERVRKVQRFSFQRPFSEAYELEQGWDGWRTDEDCPCEHVRLAERPQLPLLPRIAPVPEYNILPAKALVATGTTMYDGSLPVKTPRSMTCTEGKSWRRDGWKVSELEWIPYYEMQRTKCVSRVPSVSSDPSVLSIPDGGFALYDFGVLTAGFPGLTIACDAPCTLYFAFDEVLSEDGDVDFTSKRLASCCNIVAWRLKDAGRYRLESFEPYAFRHAKVLVRGGKATVSDVHIREYENPEAGRAKFRSSDPALDKVFEAARKTFAENAVDGFMDCPGRERAGWNCDGFFTGRAAIEFTGNASEEKLFLQNFLLPEKFPDIPDGMLPQCYPADFPDHSMIPNWAMWFVLELDEYFARTGDCEMVDAMKPRVLKLMDFFWKCRNEDGLLEKLPPSVFVEWSRSNALTRDVNYPTNMTWARVLEVVARLYGVPGYADEAERVRETVRRQSWNGTFFVDRALRQKDGSLKPDAEATETCQYYAFFFGTATPESHPELWKRLVEDFGPKRKTDNKWPDVAFSNAFIGNYLRFECLSKAGLSAQILEEAKGYFSFMAERTGTLWEHDAPTASCSHGFACHIAHVLYRDVLGVREIDRVNRRIALRFADVPLDWCEGEIPVEGGWLKVSWRRENGRIKPSCSAPEGWRIESVSAPAAETRDLFSDTWDAMDDLGRRVASAELPLPRAKQVGIFYWMWHQGQKGPVLDNSKILAEDPTLPQRPEDPKWGRRQTHYWGKPAFGYYATTDAWVLRRHAQLLSAAGVDAVVFDATNGTFTWMDSLGVLMRTWGDMRAKGERTPQFAYMLPFMPWNDQAVSILQLYRDVYRPGVHRELWFQWEGKPLIHAAPELARSKAKDMSLPEADRRDYAEIAEFFTFRPLHSAYAEGPKRPDHWCWLEVYPQHEYGKRKDGTVEMCAAGVAQNHSWRRMDGGRGLAAMNDTNVFGRAYMGPDEADLRPGETLRFAPDRNPRRGEPNRFLWGDNFAQQLERARRVDPDYMFVTGWNEFIAGCFDEWQGKKCAFPDQYSSEFSRDIEPSEGILKDSFYCQLVDGVRRFKGARPQRPASQGPVFRDAAGDVDHRDARGWGEIRYVDRTGRNDIVECFVLHDAESLTFTAVCAGEVTPRTDPAWMRLFISVRLDADDPSPHWHHLHFVVNRVAPPDGETAMLERCLGGWSWEETARVAMKVVGNALSVTVPRAAIGQEDRVDVRFKWADNTSGENGDGDILDFYRHGDAAPDGRFLYRYFE